MKTTRKNLLRNLKIGVCALALSGILITPNAAAYAETDVSDNADAKVEQNTQDQTAEKRKEIMVEAVSALRETHNALKALDEGKSKEALSALETSTGKLEIILARDPGLALAPTGVSAITHDLLGSVKAVNQAREDAEDFLEDGKVQDARRILRGLASETVISTTNLPLATYPAAIKSAARLIDEGKTEEAKVVLQSALNTLVITKQIIPLPVIMAENLLSEAEALAENEERSEEETTRLLNLLDAAENEIQFAQALGYGEKKDFEDFYKEIEAIREKTSDGKSGSGFFDKIKGFMTSMTEDSQPESASNNNQERR